MTFFKDAWFREFLGTGIFTIVTLSAWSDDSFMNNAAVIGVTFALCHSVFKSDKNNDSGLFNPALVFANYVCNSERNLLETLKVISAQYVGCAVSLCLMGHLTGDSYDTHAPTEDGKGSIVILAVCACLLVKFFKKDGTNNFEHIGIWYAIIHFIVHLVQGNAESAAEVANPALFASVGFQKLLSLEDYGWEKHVLYNSLALYFGAFIGALITNRAALRE